MALASLDTPERIAEEAHQSHDNGYGEDRSAGPALFLQGP